MVLAKSMFIFLNERSFFTFFIIIEGFLSLSNLLNAYTLGFMYFIIIVGRKNPSNQHSIG